MITDFDDQNSLEAASVIEKVQICTGAVRQENRIEGPQSKSSGNHRQPILLHNRTIRDKTCKNAPGLDKSSITTGG